MKILIVEDSMLYRKTIVKYLKEHLPQAEFITAPDGAEGYKLFRQEAPDFMVVDLLMPVMNGMELLRKIKEEGLEVRSVVLSADIQKITRQEVEKLDVLAFYTKPFTREHAGELAALISGQGGSDVKP